MDIRNMITEPTLLLDEERVRHHIRAMAEKARRQGIQFRPHFKTHQSAEIGRWFREEGVDRITVSSLRMAEYFARDGWEDILVAFPLNLREADTVRRLAQKVRLGVLIESEKTAQWLVEQIHFPTEVYIEVDVGYRRTGIAPEQRDLIETIVSIISRSSHHRWRGFLTHAGQTYQAREKEQIQSVYLESVQRLQEWKMYFRKRGFDPLISWGDTPSCSVMDSLEGVDEIRPGNFVFYDLMQWQIGSCSLQQIAVVLACPVVSLHPERDEIVVYGGAVHLSKERMEWGDEGPIYGRAVFLNNRGWEIPEIFLPVISLSQEHGKIRMQRFMMAHISPGDLIGILPVHSCLTVHAMKKYLTLGGRWIDAMTTDP